MGRGRIAGDGEGVAEISRPDLRRAATRLRTGQPARRALLLLSVRSLGMAADVLPRGAPRFARDLRPEACQRVGSLGDGKEGRLARTPRVDPRQLEAVSVPHT